MKQEEKQSSDLGFFVIQGLEILKPDFEVMIFLFECNPIEFSAGLEI